MIDTEVTVGADTVIEPFVQLLGETKVGRSAGSAPIPCWRTRPLEAMYWCGRAASLLSHGWMMGRYSARMRTSGRRARLAKGHM